MELLTADEFQKDVALPPANFQIWPVTRIGALTVDVLLLLAAILLWVIPRKVYRIDHIGKDGDVDDVSSERVVALSVLCGMRVCLSLLFCLYFT